MEGNVFSFNTFAFFLFLASAKVQLEDRQGFIFQGEMLQQ
jgi:hypothetical protein